VSDQVTVLVDGRTVGDLTVNQDYPDSRMTVTVPKPGQHSYTAEATAVFNADGNLLQYTGVGQGMIDVEPGRIYSLQGSISGNPWLVSIVEQR
jgi:ABC-type sugar transport system ATPase subunit